MASVNMIVAYVGIVGALLVVPCFSSDAPTPNPDDFHIVPAPAPVVFNYLEGCIEKLDPHCPELGEVLIGKRKDVDSDCCSALVRMGKRCHFSLLRVLPEVEEVYKPFSSVLHQRGVEIWNHCVRRVGNPSLIFP
ncbi:hypothetical protein AQUCO_01500427v1 [Aquilegia coerulea]|uniref:Prolamin-like domain-containing protein n=1 Tax=Aquilegia coerulea TaxID=218851 RepID=A0A2G5DTV2_AQUCA|nr:hypothetical protein AQUCO_01500427v1 [Aquilegia coerulea]